jgi:hypothetical protein
MSHCVGDKLLGGASFADARLAHQHHQPPPACERILQSQL